MTTLTVKQLDDLRQNFFTEKVAKNSLDFSSEFSSMHISMSTIKPQTISDYTDALAICEGRYITTLLALLDFTFIGRFEDEYMFTYHALCKSANCFYCIRESPCDDSLILCRMHKDDLKSMSPLPPITVRRLYENRILHTSARKEDLK